MNLRFLVGTLVVSGSLAADYLAHTYLVEFANDHNIESFYHGLELENIKFSPRLNMTYHLFRGASFELVDGASNSSLSNIISKMPTVKSLWPVGTHKVPIDTVNSTIPLLARREIQKRADGNDTFSTHVMTQVDKLRAKGITGKGARVAVVDSGIDYNHPALGGCFGQGCLVGYGWNVLGELRPGSPQPVNDPIDPCLGHGTHVAGIIAAQPNPFGFTGAAPGVTLGAYRTSTCAGIVYEDVLVAAINRAYDDGSNIINLSLDLPSDWSEHPAALAAQRIVEKGVPVVAAIGNDGERGLWTSVIPAVAHGVAGVANFFNTETPAIHVVASYSVDNATAQPFSWQAGNPAMPNISLPLWSTSFDAAPDDGCGQLPAGAPDLSKVVVLVQDEDKSSDCRIDNKLSNLGSHGAKYVLVYSLDAYTRALTQSNQYVNGIGMVPNSRGKEWINLLKAGHKIVVNLVIPGAAQQTVYSPKNTETGGLMSTRSSWGMSWELDVKPQIGAPGQNILSTWLLSKGGYRIDSGTSMASPFVAAVYALIAEARKTFDPATLESFVSATANPNLYYDGTKVYSIVAPVVQQGAGLIQAYDAAFATTLLNVSSLAFNDTDHFVAQHGFTIKNLGSGEVTYTLSHVKAATVYASGASYLSDPQSFSLAPTPLETVDAWASLIFSTTSVKVGPGASATISVTASPPAASIDKGRLPVYSGYIAINSTSGESLSLPYAGVATSMKSVPVLTTRSSVTYLTSWDSLNIGLSVPLPENTTFTIPVPTGDPNGTENPDPGLALPTAIFGQNVGSAFIRLDIVPLEVNGTLATTEVLGVTIAGSAERYPIRWYPGRGSTMDPFRGMLSDGRVVPEGRYKFLMRALKVFGDPENKDDYDALELPAFFLKYQG